LVFGKVKDGKHYFMLIHPNGAYEFYNKLDDFSAFDLNILNECSDFLTDYKGKEKTIVASTNGNINVISRTNRYPLPAKEIFQQEVLSRSISCKNRQKQGRNTSTFTRVLSRVKESTFYD
jgi:hypothetical protein